MHASADGGRGTDDGRMGVDGECSADTSGVGVGTSASATCNEEAARLCDAADARTVGSSSAMVREGGRLTPSQERLLGFIASRCVTEGSVALTKRELAARMGCCVRTVDRAVMRLRAEGYVEVHELYGADGAQVANEYCLATRA